MDKLNHNSYVTTMLRFDVLYQRGARAGVSGTLAIWVGALKWGQEVYSSLAGRPWYNAICYRLCKQVTVSDLHLVGGTVAHPLSLLGGGWRMGGPLSDIHTRLTVVCEVWFVDIDYTSVSWIQTCPNLHEHVESNMIPFIVIQKVWALHTKVS